MSFSVSASKRKGSSMFSHILWTWICGSMLVVTFAMTEDALNNNNKTDQFESKPFNVSKKAGKSKMPLRCQSMRIAIDWMIVHYS